jgi:hypothetical protein
MSIDIFNFLTKLVDKNVITIDQSETIYDMYNNEYNPETITIESSTPRKLMNMVQSGHVRIDHNDHSNDNIDHTNNTNDRLNINDSINNTINHSILDKSLDKFEDISDDELLTILTIGWMVYSFIEKRKSGNK